MGKLVCRIELDKEGGATVTITNGDDDITQMIELDGTSITISVAKGGDTSTWVQTADRIEVTCKTFHVEAEKISLHSTGDSSWACDGKLALSSTGDAGVKSSGELELNATGDLKMEGMNLKAEGKVDAELKGVNTSIKGDAEVKVAGLQVSIAADAKAGLKGAMTTVEGSGMLSLESSGVATLKGSMANVDAPMIKLG